jgi:prepilin signal peptidase PulO-like enzyme (type II secretory pathway)
MDLVSGDALEAASTPKVPASGQGEGSAGVLTALSHRRWVLGVLIPALCALLLSRLDGWWAALVYVPLLGVLGPVLGVLDVELLRLPNCLVLPTIPVEFAVLVMASVVQDEVGVLVRVFVAAGVTAVLLGCLAAGSGGAFGWGDVKLSAGLLAPALAWSGWPAVVVAAWCSFGSAAVVAVVSRRLRGTGELAFGPYLLTASALVVLWRGSGT